jgi:DNA (cytosine-5)-methyltransferase 1
VIVMENVPGMVSWDGGRFIKDIYSLFGQAGYRMHHMILCAAHYGIPLTGLGATAMVTEPQ